MNFLKPKKHSKVYIEDTKLSCRLKRYLYRFLISKRKLSTKNLERLCKDYATNMKTLIVHSEDVNYKPYFPNAYTVTKRLNLECDMHMDLYYRDLRKIKDNSFDVVVCTGLLEHVPEPYLLVEDLRRICKVGGKVIISASSVFSYHEGPDDFFHFTPYSMKLLLNKFSKIEMIRGSSQPFETIGILLQRILIQCDIFPVIRPFIELLAVIVPVLDKFIVFQFDTNQKKTKNRLIDSMMPSNIQAAAIK